MEEKNAPKKPRHRGRPMKRAPKRKNPPNPQPQEEPMQSIPTPGEQINEQLLKDLQTETEAPTSEAPPLQDGHDGEGGNNGQIGLEEDLSSMLQSPEALSMADAIVSGSSAVKELQQKLNALTQQNQQLIQMFAQYQPVIQQITQFLQQASGVQGATGGATGGVQGATQGTPTPQQGVAGIDSILTRMLQFYQLSKGEQQQGDPISSMANQLKSVAELFSSFMDGFMGYMDRMQDRANKTAISSIRYFARNPKVVKSIQEETEEEDEL